MNLEDWLKNTTRDGDQSLVGVSPKALSRLLEELEAYRKWSAAIAPKYEQLALLELERHGSARTWPEGLIGCRGILESCPLSRDEWEEEPCHKKTP